MRPINFTLALATLAAVSVSAQFNATITVTDLDSGTPVENASVMLDGNFMSTDAAGEAIFIGLSSNTYDYSVSASCFDPGSGMITIAGADASASVGLNATNTNNLFFYIGDPMALIDATVEVSDGGNYYASFVTWDTFGGEMLEGVPFGEISYTISKPCYETVTGTVMVDCNNGDGIIVSANPAPATTNNLFFYIGDPMAIIGATVEVTNGVGYDTSFVTSDTFGGEMLGDVPFGTISYTITTPCYETVTGTVGVDCNNGDGILVSANPEPIFIDASVTIAGNTLTATATGVDYQWVDCNNNNAPIDGANEQSFEATESGSYAVILSSGDCSETSECTSMTMTGVDELQGRDAFAVYPVPFSDKLTVRTNGTLGSVRVEIFNLTGQLVMDQTHGGMEITLHTADLPSGCYVLRLTAENSRTTMSVVK